MRGVLLTVALLSPLLIPACSFETEEAGEKTDRQTSPAPLVRVTRPEVRSMERRLPMTAKMTPLLEGEVVARVQGIRVLELLKDVGDEVKKGEALARLERIDLEHALDEAKSAVEEAQTKIDEAQLNVVELKAEKIAHLTTVARMKQVWDRLKSQTRGVAQDELLAVSDRAATAGWASSQVPG